MIGRSGVEIRHLIHLSPTVRHQGFALIRKGHCIRHPMTEHRPMNPSPWRGEGQGWGWRMWPQARCIAPLALRPEDQPLPPPTPPLPPSRGKGEADGAWGNRITHTRPVMTQGYSR